MPISKRVLIIGAASFVASTSSIAIAQTKAKSKSVTQLGEGDAVWIDPKTGNVQKSNTKVSAAKMVWIMKSWTIAAAVAFAKAPAAAN